MLFFTYDLLVYGMLYVRANYNDGRPRKSVIISQFGPKCPNLAKFIPNLAKIKPKFGALRDTYCYCSNKIPNVKLLLFKGPSVVHVVHVNTSNTVQCLTLLTSLY